MSNKKNHGASYGPRNTVKSFWLVFVIELGDTDMRLSQSMCFVVEMISGSLVSWRTSLFR